MGTKTVIHTVTELQSYTQAHQRLADRTITVDYDRSGTKGSLPVTLNSSGPGLGIYIDAFNTVRVPVLRAPGVALTEVNGIASTTWGALKDFGATLVTHGKLDSTVSGPVGIYTATSQASREGFMEVLYLTIVLSVNLALLNVLPIPPLDGGKLFFLLLEFIFRRRIIRQEVEGVITMIGIVLVGGLVIIITVRDILHLF
jgi:regulator of sigma E protease